MELFDRLAQSKFRSGFYLKEKDKAYAADKGREKIEKHAQDFIRMRLAPAVIPNDGKQTPMKGHPVFLAQHACACCCRGCLEKWHGIPKGRELTGEEQEYVVDVLMTGSTGRWKDTGRRKVWLQLPGRKRRNRSMSS